MGRVRVWLTPTAAARGRLPFRDALVRAALAWVREMEGEELGVCQTPLEAYFTAVEEEEEEEDGGGGGYWPESFAPLPASPLGLGATDAEPFTPRPPPRVPPRHRPAGEGGAHTEILQNLSGRLASLKATTVGTAARSTIAAASDAR